MKIFFIGVIGFILVGCKTLGSYPGYYSVKAYDVNGNQIETANVISDGSSVNRLINATCLAFPGAKLVIRSVKTKKELSELSPYQCKNKSTINAKSQFQPPKKMEFDDQVYSLIYKNKNSQQAIYEYTTNKENIKNWKTLITFKYENKNSSPDEIVKKVKSTLNRNVKKVFIEKGHAYMVLLFLPDKKHPYYETSIKKSFHNVDCGGMVELSYAKKYPLNTSSKIIADENDAILAKMKKNSWKPACTK